MSGISGQTQAAHIRQGGGGMGLKPGDDMCVPLSWMEHEKQHRIGERKYWPDIARAKHLARDLYAVSGDRESALLLIARFRNERMEKY